MNTQSISCYIPQQDPEVTQNDISLTFYMSCFEELGLSSGKGYMYLFMCNVTIMKVHVTSRHIEGLSRGLLHAKCETLSCLEVARVWPFFAWSHCIQSGVLFTAHGGLKFPKRIACRTFTQLHHNQAITQSQRN